MEPLPSGSLGTRWKKVILTIAHTKSGSAAFVSLSSMNDFLIALCVVGLRAGLHERGTSRDGQFKPNWRVFEAPL